MNANTPQSRFWSKVDKTDTCWLWTGAKIPKGYGRFWDGRRCYKSGPPYRKCRACDVARHAAARLRKEVGCRTGDSR